MTYTLVDLFCGTGAFSLAFHSTNKVSTIYANDILESSETIVNHNRLTDLFVRQNINDIDCNSIPLCDILTAGFPCQPFSIAGLQKGFDDERSNVFWKILSIIQHCCPKIVILENVKNLQSHDNGNTFTTIIDHLEKLNYHIKYSLLDTSKLTGIPHHRERMYIVCFQDKKIYEHFHFDFPEIEITPVSHFLQDPNTISDKYYYTNRVKISDELNRNVINHISTNTVYQYRRFYVRENKTGVCPTLTANMGTGGHNIPIILDDKGIRKLTPRECFSLQGFPSDYKLPNIPDAKLYCLAGNAVSVPIVKLIADRLLTILEQ